MMWRLVSLLIIIAAATGTVVVQGVELRQVRSRNVALEKEFNDQSSTTMTFRENAEKSIAGMNECQDVLKECVTTLRQIYEVAK